MTVIAIQRLTEWYYSDTIKVSSAINFSYHNREVGDITNDDLEVELYSLNLNDHVEVEEALVGTHIPFATNHQELSKRLG